MMREESGEGGEQFVVPSYLCIALVVVVEGLPSTSLI
tara:strand:+ start:1912 stop:2022 length:111 start_codon:yes stop_codon:yes gene_type:complete